MLISPGLFFAGNAVLFSLAALILRQSRFYTDLLHREASGARYVAIDGLRGFLAFGVFFHHAVITYYFLRTGRWTSPPVVFYKLTGDVGVSLFFMITAFLFWNKVRERDGQVDTLRLYVSRIRRIVPLYVVSVVLVVLIAFERTGFQIDASLPALLDQISAWFAFGFRGVPLINNYAHTLNINSVYWSLAFEWLFYLALPLLGVFCRGPRFWGLVALTLLFSTVGRGQTNYLCFLCGVLVAHVQVPGRVRELLASPLLAPIPVLAIAAVFLFFPSGYRVGAVLLMGIFFFFIAHHNTLLGLLATRPARLLGTISYSIYLLHNIVVFCTSAALNAVYPSSAWTEELVWLWTLGAGAVVLFVSCLTYRYVEHPFLAQPPVLGPGLRGIFFAPAPAAPAAPAAAPPPAT